MTERKRRSREFHWNIVSLILVILVSVLALFLIVVRLCGFRVFTVMSGSMEPSLPVGSLIWVKDTYYQELNVGDIITFVADENNTVVTHRISAIEVNEEDNSVWRFHTKGDANSTEDGKPVYYKNVLGTPIFSLPILGFVAWFIQRPPGIYIALVVGTLLLAWAFLPKTLKERSSRRKGNDGDGDSLDLSDYISKNYSEKHCSDEHCSKEYCSEQQSGNSECASEVQVSSETSSEVLTEATSEIAPEKQIGDHCEDCESGKSLTEIERKPKEEQSCLSSEKNFNSRKNPDGTRSRYWNFRRSFQFRKYTAKQNYACAGVDDEMLSYASPSLSNENGKDDNV